jgi:hypothetical protein
MTGRPDSVYRHASVGAWGFVPTKPGRIGFSGVNKIALHIGVGKFHLRYTFRKLLDSCSDERLVTAAKLELLQTCVGHVVVHPIPRVRICTGQGWYCACNLGEKCSLILKFVSTKGSCHTTT